ncbi:radical SAM domain-containing protein [Gottschalkia acidurici 9a]|uniref:Radical SAM domain-containing protein n=1 Tax=Gottschalkia acidurici (strain ATCC 7906 / DSM 604 / BCRC 14475 / CIP 104303 / KCTC 5404 / NCIMB 10678 / 9a) TaxID=1128398 RepID=K0B3Y3_GOTA9|nr:arsenosugar biosynthesis radical SAM (seleno)protein ArsS [Gottschalkia acidurici]AFS79630.1 radical SAM domain-containing protein [Gottschalkia acidurici 9a]
MIEGLFKDTVKFEDTLKENKLDLKRKEIGTLQINVGKKCNQVCVHCHVNGGPDREEVMDRKTIDRILELIKKNKSIDTVDITGGAPELNPKFKYLISELSFLNKTILNRCNLTILLESGQEDTAEFLANNKVQIMASLPCYLEGNVDYQRGDDVFKKSISALKKLNSLGYGKKDTDLILNLVFNPKGGTLPPPQKALEKDYKKHLKENYDIDFNQLLTITNMPISRFQENLKREGKYEEYCNLLLENFNPDTALNVMCRDLLSISWDGKIYDCDFNQALEITLKNKSISIWDISDFSDVEKEISFANHCFGCTAGSGSSCTGALV